MVVPSTVAGVTEIPGIRIVGRHARANALSQEDLRAKSPMRICWLAFRRGHPTTGCAAFPIRPREWTLSGEPATFQEAFPNGPIETAIVGGVRVYDPRKDTTNGGDGSHRRLAPETWEFSDNQRLCTLDWLTWQDGYAKPWDRIDWASWVPQINLADQNVPLKAGGTEKRYRVATRVGLDEPRSRVLHRLHAGRRPAALRDQPMD